MKRTILAGAAIALTAAPAFGQDPSQQGDEKKICRTEKVTGSRTKTQRICMTAAEWRAAQQQTRKGLDEMGRDASGGYHRGTDVAAPGPDGVPPNLPAQFSVPGALP